MLTISQLAAYAGTTVRAVRHYHEKGLLPEPQRDHSGYRRYDAPAVVELIKIRTLADAGVPLSRVHDLLSASDDEFQAAIQQIDERLDAEISERQRHRERIAQLAAGDSLALPPEATAYLARMAELGLPQRLIDGERDAWILVAAQLPQHMPFYMQSKQQQLDDPATLALYRKVAEAIDWPADDRRAIELANQLADLLDAAEADGVDNIDDNMSQDLADLLDSVFLTSVPIARSMLRQLEARGWTGWTKLARVASRR